MTLPITPDSVLSFINCSCTKGCSTNRCSCKKASLKCSDLCRCKDCQNSMDKPEEQIDDEEIYDSVFDNDFEGDSDSDTDIDLDDDNEHPNMFIMFSYF